MEKYFIVNENSSLHSQYFKWKQNMHDVNEHIKAFFAKHEIEANKYAPYKNALYIEPTENDKIKFFKMLCKETKNGLCKFKDSSAIRKAWSNLIYENKLEILHKPMVGFYFSTIGHSSSRIFDYDGVLYCSIEAETMGIPSNDKGIIEIKASEFYKVIESIEESDRN